MMGDTPVLPTIFLYLLCAGVFIWFCFIKRREEPFLEELKYLAGYFAIGFLSIITAVLMDVFDDDYSSADSVPVDINLNGVFRKFWFVLRPYLLCFAFLSGIRLLIFALRQRFAAKKRTES